MPELPEVEFARRALRRWLTGATVVGVQVSDARILGGRGHQVRADLPLGALIGRKVRKVERRGKWLRLVLDEGLAFSHLGMTGKWALADSEAPLRAERLRLDVKKGGVARSVRYLDPRLFGRFLLSVEDLPVWRALGPDPLNDGIDVDSLHAALQGRAGTIKAALLDQALLAGLGNIQATEALFAARLDPRRPARSLSRAEVAALARAIDRSIRRTLELETGPQITYVEEAGAANPFVIYGRAGEPCPRCRRPLEKLTLGGRGTVLCASCQR